MARERQRTTIVSFEEESPTFRHPNNYEKMASSLRKNSIYAHNAVGIFQMASMSQ
jgi:hypothetical protein